MREIDQELFDAAGQGNLSEVKKCLNRGANINAVDNNGMTALHWAAKKSEEEVAKLLIDKGADVYAEDKDGKKPLDIARELWPHSRVTQLLYENDYSLQEVATYAGEVAVGTAEVAGVLSHL